MKTLKLLFVFAISAVLLNSCSSNDTIIVEEPTISLNQLLSSNELWYVDINATQGFGEVPFLQIAFTVSFRNGTMYANNNLVGIGSQGDGFGIPIGNYDAFDMVLDTDHDIDGFDSFDVFQVDSNTIELYNPFTDTSYFLNGFQRSNFDYDFVFYDNIFYFLQEYEAWEKTFTSEFGALNEFDNENYLQFLSGNDDSVFRSSQDIDIANPSNIIFDFEGVYGVGDVEGDDFLKTLTLDYDFFDNEFFELSVIDDGTIELFHDASGTLYEFKGRGYIQFLREANAQGRMIKQTDKSKKRKQKSTKVDNPRQNTRNT